MTLKQIAMLPQVKHAEKRTTQYVVVLADGWKVYPNNNYSFPLSPTRFHHASDVRGLAAFVGRAEKVRPEKPINMRKLAKELGGELAEKILDVLREHHANMTSEQAYNFPRVVLNEISKHYNITNE